MVRDVAGTLVRAGLAAVWLISGAIKAADPAQTYLAVAAFDVLPPGVADPVASTLPFIELALGVALLAGFAVRAAAVGSAVLLLAFIAGVAQAWARGLSIDCGCFGGGGQVASGDTRYPQELARDLGFLALAGWLIIRPRTLFAIDTLLRRPVAVRPVPAEDGG